MLTQHIPRPLSRFFGVGPGDKARGRAACAAHVWSYNPELCQEIVGVSLSKLKTTLHSCVYACSDQPLTQFQIRIFTKVECPQLSTCTSHKDYCQTVSMKETIKAGAQSRTVEIIAWWLTEVTSCRGSCMNKVHIYTAEIQLPT